MIRRFTVVTACLLFAFAAGCDDRGPVGVGIAVGDSGVAPTDDAGNPVADSIAPTTDSAAPPADVGLPPDAAAPTGRVASRYISAWIGRPSTAPVRESGYTSYVVNTTARTWTGVLTRPPTKGRASVKGSYTVSANGTGALVTGGSSLSWYVPSDGSAFIAATTAGSAQFMEVGVKVTGTSFNALDTRLRATSYRYAVMHTSDAGAAGASIGKIDFRGTSATGGTWSATQLAARNFPGGAMPTSGTFRLDKAGNLQVVIGRETFVGAAQDGYGMLVAGKATGGAGILIAIDSARSANAARYNGKVLRNVWYEDSAATTMAGRATGTFRVSSPTATTIAGSFSATFTSGTTADTQSGAYSETVSSILADGALITDDTEPARYRYQLNEAASRGVYTDLEERPGSDVEIGVILGD